MQPSAKWKNITPWYDNTIGLNQRTGSTSISDNDFTTYPPFTDCEYPDVYGQSSNIFWWYTNGDFSLNSPIDDWSIAYTAVANPDLSFNNIGVFMSNSDDPAFYTDKNAYAPIAFYTSAAYKVILDNITGTPYLNDAYRFKNPPYSDSRYIWSPNAGGAYYEDDPGIFYRDANTQGYAAMISSFGIKSLFLEIRVRPTNIDGDGLPLQDYSLKDYAAFTLQQRLDNPISNAYCMVHRRADTNGTYSQVNNFYMDINLVMGTPLKGYSSDIYTYFSNVKNVAEIETIYLPLWGIPYKGRSGNYIRYCDGTYSVPDGQNTSDFFYGYDKADGTIVQSIGGGEYRYIKYILGTDDNIEYLRKCCAAYGLFFCESIYTSDNKNLESSELEANDGRWLHNDMFLGIIEDSGYTEGRYSRGIANGLQSQFSWTDSTESTYNPDVPPVPENHYSSSTTFNSIGNLATLTRRYALSGGAVTNLGKNLWKISDDIAVSDPLDPYAKYDAQILNTFLTSNPIDCIISLRRYPLTLPYGSSTTIKLGKVDTLVSCYEMDEPCHTYEFRGIPIMPNFGNSFLDYAPYTEFELYVPFCGTTKLNPADILGRTLNVKLVVDFDTGTCTGYIMSNNLVIETINGSIAIDIPVTGTDSTTVQAQLSHGIITAESAKTQERMTYGKTLWPTGIVSAVLNPFGTANTFAQNEANVNKAQYDVEHTVAPSHVIGSASPVSKWAIDLNCRLIIYYPTGKCIELVNGVPQFESNELNMFGAHVGFATLDEVSHYDTYTGLIVGANPKLGQMQTQNGTRYATADELNMIRQAIEQGIII